MENNAEFVLSERKTLLLKDKENFLYYFYKNNTDGTVATYRCVKKRSLNCPAVAKLDKQTNKILEVKHSHVHGSNLLEQTVREIETEFVNASATVGQTSKKRVNEELRVRVEQEAPELVSSMSKTRAVSQRINRAVKKLKGATEPLPSSTAELLNKLPDKYRTTCGGGEFLQVVIFIKN